MKPYHEQTKIDIQERARALGISKERLSRMLDESSFQTKYNKVTPTERVLSNPNHHMVKPKGTMFYFKLVFKGKAISKPLSTDETEARAMRDTLLIQYNYGKLAEKTTV